MIWLGARNTDNGLLAYIPAVVIMFLKVALQDSIGNTTVSMAAVLLIDSTKLLVAARRLLGHDGTGNRNDLFLAISSVLEQGRTPSVATDCSACNKDGSSGKLAGKKVEKVVGLERSIQDVARELDNLLIGMTSLEEAH